MKDYVNVVCINNKFKDTYTCLRIFDILHLYLYRVLKRIGKKIRTNFLRKKMYRELITCKLKIFTKCNTLF